jgi:hypothetical protein
MIFQTLSFSSFVGVTVIGSKLLSLGALTILIGNGISMIVRIGLASTAFMDWRDFIHHRLVGIVAKFTCIGIVCHSILYLFGDQGLEKTVAIIGVCGLIAVAAVVRPFKEMVSSAKAKGS